MPILAGMRSLKCVYLVVEFGRRFEGELGFLEAPEWRSDLRWLAGRAGEEVSGERVRGGNFKGFSNGEEREVRVECVILTRGGEHA